MKVSLVVIPLLFLFVISMFAVSGLGSSTNDLGNGWITGIETPTPYYYDWTGRPLIWVNNMSRVNEAGWFQVGSGGNAVFINGSAWSLYNVGYYLYLYPEGNSSIVDATPVSYETVMGQKQALLQSKIMDFSVGISTSWGLLALITGMIVAIAIIGFKVLDSGESETSLRFILVGGGLLAVWAVFSIISMALITDIPYGSIFYLGLTLAYCVGIILNSGTG